MRTGYIICLKDGSIVPARSVEILHSGLRFTSSKGLVFSLSPAQIVQAWEVSSEQPLPVEALDGFTHLVAALHDCEEAYLRFQTETGITPSPSPILFGAASLTLSILPYRTSEDVDFILPEEFIEWADRNWQDRGHLQVDLADENLLRLCGSWRSRTSKLQGRKITFALMHPYDTIMQKLLRWDAARFLERDVPDIEAILAAIPAEPGTLEHLLTENHLRYLPDPGSPLIPNPAEAVKRNTTWFLQRFLPHITFEQIAHRSSLRHHTQLLRLSLVPNPERTLADLVSVTPLPLAQPPNE